mgnify:CR=1 FL=1
MKEGNVVQHHGLYRSEFEHDNCGIGAIVNIKGQKSHDTVANALKIVENLEHRAGKDAEGKTGDGVGILLQVSHRFFSKVCKPLGIFLRSERDYGVGMFLLSTGRIKEKSGKEDIRSDRQKRRNEFPWMERSSGEGRCTWKQSGRMYAMYYAGIY